VDTLYPRNRDPSAAPPLPGSPTATARLLRLAAVLQHYRRVELDPAYIIRTRDAPELGGACIKMVGYGPHQEFVIKNFLVSAGVGEVCEVLAGRLYDMAGLRVPSLYLLELDRQWRVASSLVAGFRSLHDMRGGVGEEECAATLCEGFIIDVWLANWDVIGLREDNVGIDGHGRTVRIDLGGSLLIRAHGGYKTEEQFGPSVDPLPFLNPAVNPAATAVFRRLDRESLERGFTLLAGVPDDRVREVVAACIPYFPVGVPRLQDLADLLIARKDDLLAHKESLCPAILAACH